MSVTVRFAPSPTGNIHIGNARTALINWLFARKHDGRFILRFDDTDAERSSQEFADQIERDLRWLGVEADAIERQSARFESYRAAAERLRAAGLLYPCYESTDELERKRKRQLARGRPPIYDRSALNLTDDDKRTLEAEGRHPHWRFLLPNFDGDPANPVRTEYHWADIMRGEQTVDLASLSDPVLIRADGTYLYTLPSVVDDIDMAVTHVLRGDDHITNTGVQIALFGALGADPPEFGHHNLLTTVSGEGLSKRLGSLSIASLADQGYEPSAVASLAVLTGTSGPIEALEDLAALAGRFESSMFTRSAAKFDPHELDGLNRRLVHEMDFAAVAERLALLEIGGGEPFWLAVRDNISKVSEASQWWHIVEHARPVIAEEDRGFLTSATKALPEEPWDAETWGRWTAAVREETGRKGRALFMPLRLALTGLDHGPELAQLLPLIGRERTLGRLS